MSRPINPAGLALIKRFEGFRANAYKLPGELYFTIGYGDYGPRVKPTDRISKAEGERRLRVRLTEFEDAVDRLVTTPISSNRRAALIAFAYNVGVGALASSTLLRLVNQRRFRRAALEFAKWSRDSRGLPLLGLVRRRAGEARLFVKPPGRHP